MSAPQNFRAAFNGFNRDDVVNYISFMTTKHENQLNQLRTEAQELRQELENRPAADDAMLEELDLLRSEVEQLKQALQEKDETIAQLQQSAQQKAAEVETALCVQEQELEAYRRAESAERRAMERVNQMFDQANGILGEIVVKLQSNTQQVNDIAEQVRADLEALENAAMNSKAILEESGAMMAAIKP